MAEYFVMEVYYDQILTGSNFSMDGIALLRSDGMLIGELTDCTGNPR